MIPLSRPALGFIFILAASEWCLAREWRGIAPMQSTRSDVIGLLNQCSEYKEACKFSSETERVYMLFAGGLSDQDCRGVKKINPETVMFIEVVPKTRLRFKDLGLVKRNLTQFPIFVSYNRKLKGYRTDGLIILAEGDEIWQLDYVPSGNDGGACADYFSDPEPFIQTSLVHPPAYVTLDCSPSEIEAGTLLRLKAYYSPMVRRGFTWSLTKGSIQSGQLTNQIVVDTTSMAGKTTVVTAEMDDGFQHVAAGSCVIRIRP